MQHGLRSLGKSYCTHIVIHNVHFIFLFDIYFITQLGKPVNGLIFIYDMCGMEEQAFWKPGMEFGKQVQAFYYDFIIT